MKGQFFIMATVIMIYTLMTLIQYVYDFSSINLVQVKNMPELEYIQYVKDALNQTALASNTSMDCVKVDSDLNSTENFLKSEMIARGMNLTVYHILMGCPSLLSNAYFNFTIKTPTTFTFTEFKIFNP